MTRRVGTLVLALALAAGMAYADAKPGGLARQLALGGSLYGVNLAINPFVFEDPVFLLINPAHQSMYSDYAFMNITGGRINGFSSGDNTYGSQFAGVNFAITKEITLGAIFSYDPSLTNQGVTQLASFINGVQGGGRAQTGLAPIEVVEAVAAFDAGILDVGFGFTFGTASNASESSGPGPASTDNQHSARLLGFRGGVLVDMGGGNSVDASAAFRLVSVTDELKGTSFTGAPANNGEYSASGTELQVLGRLKLRVSRKVSFVPYVGFFTASGEPKQDAPPTGGTPFQGSAKISATALAAGAGMEYKSADFYFAGGLSFVTAKQSQETTPPPPGGTTTTSTSVTQFPAFNMGGEWWFLEWLGARAGYYRAFQSTTSKTEPPAGGVTSESSQFVGYSIVPIGTGVSPDNGLITLGLGLRFGGFALDATVSEDALRRGLGLIGSQDNMNTFGYVTLSYGFQ